ncbi:MAG: zinc ribbon domain-containing protein [Eubacteriales bacterium]|nr:zinc ribbon domain-containing protein [Eubacteriales bacterium]
MAMIQCPRCGEMVSDKAKKCVHCGFELIPEEKKYCQECGAELMEGEKICPKCGCPVETAKEEAAPAEPQQVEVTGVKVTQKSKRTIGIVAAVIAAILVAFLGFNQLQKHNAEKEAEKLRVQYGTNLHLVTVTMLDGASDAEKSGNLIKQVWYNAIYEERSSETDPYTRPKGYFVSDFNDALGNLFADSDFKDKIAAIKENQSTVQNLMKELKNPPEEYEDAYDALSDLYDAYTKLTNLAVNPSGNLQTFSSNFTDADTETANCYNAMQLYLD